MMATLRLAAPLAALLALVTTAPAANAQRGNSSTTAPNGQRGAPTSQRSGAGGNQSAAADRLPADIRAIRDSIHPVYGDVRITRANAVLHLARDYYFLDAADARRVIVDAWGNPPTEASDVLGMVFAAGTDFTQQNAWGAVITFRADGYVSDSDASSIDYTLLLTQMQAAEVQNNATRTAAGYPTSNLVGWAQQPTYDAQSHSLIWARNYRISGDSENSLNYDVRMLGRRGVLSMNFVTGMSQLETTRVAAQRLAAAAEFTPGERYADYQEGTDRVAEYGLAGLVAGGAALGLAKNAGILGGILAFGKKAIVLIIAGIAGLGALIRRMFGGGNSDDDQGGYA